MKLLLIFLVVFLPIFLFSQTYVAISDKTSGTGTASDTLTFAEFNKILDAIDDGTLSINTTSITVGGTNYTVFMLPSAARDSIVAVFSDSSVSKLGQSIDSSEVTNASIIEADIKIYNPPSNGYVLGYATGYEMQWQEDDDVPEAGDFGAATDLDGNGKLSSDVVDEEDIADNGINSEHYNDASIDAAHLAPDIIDETKIADNGIDSEHYNDGSIDEPHLNVSNVPTDNYLLSYNAAGTNFTWVVSPSAGAAFDRITVDTLAGQTGNSIFLEDTLKGIGSITGLYTIETDSINVDSLVVADMLIFGSASIAEAELEILDGATLSTTELNYVDNVTSAIQTQLNAKGALDTLTYNWGVMDTVLTGALPGWKVPFAITIIEIASYTDANTTTFNIEERAEATPNTAGTDALAADQVGDTNQQEATSFSNAGFAANTWMTPVISATGDVAIFSISVRYIKQ